uniref:UV-stimulated scaffold protein A n=2 Tax=Varanus komodoensis TaxID=61221 RepID=A0A8D2L9J5_VARKO
MAQLGQPHAQVRLAALQVARELFARSHRFRSLLLADFQEFLALAAGTDLARPLPAPHDAARGLRRAAIGAVQEWHERFGGAYRQLALGHRFLQRSKKVDFQDIHARTLAERRRDEEKQKRLDAIYKDKAKKAEKEMEDMSQDIQMVLTEMENGFQLLMPDPFDFVVNDTGTADAKVDRPAACSPVQVVGQQGPSLEDERPCCSKDLPPIPRGPKAPSRDLTEETEGDMDTQDGSEPELTSGGPGEDDDRESFVRSHGLGSHKYTLSLEIATDVELHENEDNTAIVSNVMDAYKLIRNKFLPSVQSWIQLFTRAGISDDRLRRAIDLRSKLDTAVEKHKKMNIEFKERNRKAGKAVGDDDSSDDEEEFVEVPEKEGYEPHIPDHLRQEYGLAPVTSPKSSAKQTEKKASTVTSSSQAKRNEEELDPTCAAATWKIIRDKLPRLQPPDDRNPDQASRKREEDEAKAPVVPFGLDILYWGQEQPTSGRILKFSSQHRFWAPNEVEEEVENKEIAGMLKSRLMTFAGTFDPVKHKCRAPMPHGGLCERQDRFKCPFHGKIIPRDESGTPVNQEDRDREAKKQWEEKEQHPEWRDPEVMKEVEAATGVDLGSSRYSGKGKVGKKGQMKRKKYPNLTDLRQQADTSRARLERKVFNKTAMKRVVKAMNRVDQRKHEKFANQFNYALN